MYFDLSFLLPGAQIIQIIPGLGCSPQLNIPWTKIINWHPFSQTLLLNLYHVVSLVALLLSKTFQNASAFSPDCTCATLAMLTFQNNPADSNVSLKTKGTNTFRVRGSIPQRNALTRPTLRHRWNQINACSFFLCQRKYWKRDRNTNASGLRWAAPRVVCQIKAQLAVIKSRNLHCALLLL